MKDKEQRRGRYGEYEEDKRQTDRQRDRHKNIVGDTMIMKILYKIVGLKIEKDRICFRLLIAT